MSLFKSFFLAGFESACHINRAGARLNMLQLTQHDRQVFGDYELLRSFNIHTVRDGTCWPLIERAGRFDFSSLVPMLEAASMHDIQVIWNVLHYGWPDDVDVFAASFVDRFARYCTALARFIHDHTDRIPFYTPINEISFLAWAAGDVGYIHPFGTERGVELKRQLIRAAIAGIEAVWQGGWGVKRAFLMGIRRLQRPAILQGVARLLPTHRDLRETCSRLLKLPRIIGYVIVGLAIGPLGFGRKRVDGGAGGAAMSGGNPSSAGAFGSAPISSSVRMNASGLQ